MKRSSLLLILWMLLAPIMAQAADAKLQSLLVDGSSSDSTSSKRVVWLMQVMTPADTPSPYTLVFQRAENDVNWTLANTIATRVTDATAYGGELAILLNDGSWMIMGQGTGRALPDGARIVTLAGRDDCLFAIGAATGSTTRPTTAATTRPATLPAQADLNGRLYLYRLDKAGWKQLLPLPATVDPNNVAMGVTRQAVPMIAYAHEGTLVLQKEDGQAWQTLGTRPADGFAPRRLLNDQDQAFLYLTGAQGSRLIRFSTEWHEPISLPKNAPQAFGLAGGQLRLVYADGGQLKEHRLSPRNLQVDGQDALINLPEQADIDTMRQYVNWAMIAIILLVIYQTYRNRERFQQVKIDWTKVRVAPLGRRFFAGLIDYVPMIVATIYAERYVTNPEDILTSVAALRIMMVGVGGYIAFTAIIEMIFGRSLGKMMTGLRVVSFNGQRPSVGALFLRNLLRIVDMALLLTLVLVFVLPLRQRVGDLAAGTVVIADREKESPGTNA